MSKETSEEIAGIASEILRMSDPPWGSAIEVPAAFVLKAKKLAGSALSQRETGGYIEDRILKLEQSHVRITNLLNKVVEGLKNAAEKDRNR